MNLKFSPFALPSVLLSANSAVGDNNDNVDSTLANRVASSYQQRHNDDQHDTTSAKIETSERFQLPSNAVRHASGVRKLEPDVGIFGKRKRHNSFGRNSIGDDANNTPAKILFSHRRTLVTDTDTTEACSINDACEPNLCSCVERGGQAADCAVELHALCQGGMTRPEDGMEFTIDGCVDEAGIYYRDAVCPFVACLVDGEETYESCDCAFYSVACSLYVDDAYYKDDEDVLQNCAADACCQTNANDIGRCFEGSPTGQPGMMPTDPTKSPTTVEGGSAAVVSTPVADKAVVAGSDSDGDGTTGDSSSGTTSSGTSTSNAQGTTNGAQATGAQVTGPGDGTSQVTDAQDAAATTGGSSRTGEAGDDGASLSTPISTSVPEGTVGGAPENVKVASASKNSAQRVSIVGCSTASFVVATTSLVWYMLG
mmetsp:Transcript_14399/g.26005  ORF Transcript_14399/g.26005 Transcript_14399/m.26005 type:complete len:426 (+) Transcript_14399:47-1324(+)